MNRMKKLLVRSLVVAVASLALLAFAAPAQAEGKKIVIDGSTTVGPIAKAFAEYMMQQDSELNITVSESGSGNGAKSLLNGACDVAAMSRFMKDSEFKAAVEKNVLPVAHVVAMDGLAVVAHPSNPVQGLTTDQLKKIYLGEIKNWKEVGGPDSAIVVISRDTNSGTYETFEKMVMNKEKMAAGIEYVGSNGAARQRVQNTTGAIAYVGLGFVDKSVKPLPVNGIDATQETVASGVYPIARPLYLFTNRYPKLGSPTHQFVTLHLSEVGQEIVESIGFVPVTEY